MNMNIDIINRARYAAGMLKETEGKGPAFLAVDDRNSASPDVKALYETCKTFYLTTYLEALSEVPWTAGRKRKRLLKTLLPHGDAGYRFTYDLPYDCARPIELSGKEYFVIEGNFLCTDLERAELQYITNGKILPDSIQFEPANVSDFPHNVTPLSPGSPDEWDIPPDVTFSGSISEIPWHGPRDYIDDDGSHIVEPAYMPEDWNPDDENMVVPFPEAIASDDDYPEYCPPRQEPKFYEYLEKMLAAKFAVKNTEQPRLHEKLLQEALMIKQDAVASTKGTAAAKKQPSQWWSEQLGLSKDL